MKAKHYIWSLLVLALPFLTGCAESEGEFVDNSNKTIFMALTLKNPSVKTRQSAAITQADEKADGSHFRGISDLTILPFSVKPTGSDCIAASDNALGGKIGVPDELPSVYTEEATSGANSKYYLEVPMKIGTNAFLVYGRATGANSDLADKQANGILSKTTGAAAGNYSFAPVPMVENIADGKAAGAAGDAIVTYLNSIFNANWADPTNYSSLYGLYPMVKEMQAGSSANVLAFINKVYELLLPARTTDYVDAALDAIEAGATVAGGAVTALPDACQNFPGDLGLPDGAAVIAWNETSKAFVAVTTKNNFNGLNIDVNKFCFPAELYYRANSRIHTATQPFISTLTPQQNAEAIFNRGKWAGTDNTSVLGQTTTSGNALFTPNGVVTASTTVIAITDPLQYAVGRLDVKLAAAANLKDAEDNTVDPTKLAITGVIIGQQSPVDFKFNSKFAAEGDPLYMIYDSKIDAAAATIGSETPTHTLALETAKNQKVNVALELQNNTGESIAIATGDLGKIIPNGCKFYLVGQVDPANPAAGSVVPTGAAEGKVIAQDYITTVTFTLNDIKQAYYVIPDLNTADMEFSLKVLDWKLSTPAGVVLQ